MITYYKVVDLNSPQYFPQFNRDIKIEYLWLISAPFFVVEQRKYRLFNDDIVKIDNTNEDLAILTIIGKKVLFKNEYFDFFRIEYDDGSSIYESNIVPGLIDITKEYLRNEKIKELLK